MQEHGVPAAAAAAGAADLELAGFAQVGVRSSDRARMLVATARTLNLPRRAGPARGHPPPERLRLAAEPAHRRLWLRLLHRTGAAAGQHPAARLRGGASS